MAAQSGKKKVEEKAEKPYVMMTDDEVIRSYGFTIHSRPGENADKALWLLGEAVYSNKEALAVATKVKRNRERLKGGLDRIT